ncbi:hypothetical protein DPMN_149178 [Dreissena polymorpha]|uniref:Uncharacterized protein n=1 Tax=Dreissena polymorpha TaxID=45954 RepID=A0A9D4FB89_DREPO|nr:hypothetical protein DPMN_149178 [Dreissena polymorpha]
MGFLMFIAVLGFFCFTGFQEVHAITNMQFVSFAIENGAELIGGNETSPYDVIHLPGKINDPLNLTALLKPLEKDLENGLSRSQLESGCGCDKSSCMCSFVRTFSVAGFKFTLNVSAIAICQQNSQAELRLTVNGRTLLEKQFR